jgi:hypothetical protein
MPKSTQWANDLLSFICKGTIPGWNASTSALYISLHTAPPGIGGTQATNETSYSGYGRVGVIRNGSSLTVVNNNTTNANAITFGACTANPQTITDFAIGLSQGSATEILYTASLASSRLISIGSTPSFPPCALSITET